LSYLIISFLLGVYFIYVEMSQVIDGFFVEGILPLLGEVKTMVSDSLPLDIRLVSALSACLVDDVWDSDVEAVYF
jgi:hypothetical protein